MVGGDGGNDDDNYEDDDEDDDDIGYDADADYDADDVDQMHCQMSSFGSVVCRDGIPKNISEGVGGGE